MINKEIFMEIVKNTLIDKEIIEEVFEMNFVDANIDSLAYISLIVALEDELNIQIPDSYLIQGQIESLSNLYDALCEECF